MNWGGCCRRRPRSPDSGAPSCGNDRLAGQAEVAVDLAAHEVLGLAAAFDHERQRELPGPRLAGVVSLARGDRQLEVHADVDDHAHRAHCLRAEHAQLVRGIIEIAELAHEPLRVERPPLAVTGEEAERALEA